VAALPNALYRVALANGHQMLARVPGKMRQRLARISPGDTVLVETSPYDLSKGWIRETKTVAT